MEKWRKTEAQKRQLGSALNNLISLKEANTIKPLIKFMIFARSYQSVDQNFPSCEYDPTDDAAANKYELNKKMYDDILDDLMTKRQNALNELLTCNSSEICASLKQLIASVSFLIKEYNYVFDGSIRLKDF